MYVGHVGNPCSGYVLTMQCKLVLMFWRDFARMALVRIQLVVHDVGRHCVQVAVMLTCQLSSD